MATIVRAHTMGYLIWQVWVEDTCVASFDSYYETVRFVTMLEETV
jgi:hypothetical protein